MDGSFKGAPAGAATSTAAELDDLERLAQLHGRGVLTAEEFAAKKRQILGM